MNKLSAIETALLDREVKALNEEICRAQGIIIKAFERFAKGSDGLPVSGTRLNELREYIYSMKLVTSRYYGGEWLCAKRGEVSTDIAKLPDFLRELILEKAVGEFMAKVDEIDEVRGLAESNQASN